MIARILSALLVIAVPFEAAAHGLSVFASADCKSLIIEAKFSNGKTAKAGEIRILDGNNTLLLSRAISPDESGASKIALNGLDTSSGLVVEVDTGSHDNYWILTPEDIRGGCRS